MINSKKLAILVVLVMIAPLVLTACGGEAEPEVQIQTVVETVVVEGEAVEVEVTRVIEETVVEEVEVEVEVTAVPEPVDRTGAWLDTVVFQEEPDSDAAVTRLEVGDIDVYAFSIADPAVAARIYDSDKLNYKTSYGGYNEITFNPYGPEFNDGQLNPFSNPKIREAMNWLIDRNYISQEINGGMSRPRYVPINFASKDTALLADRIAAVELTYAYNPDKAAEVITAEMEGMGAVLTDGKWTYNGEPVTLIGLIRTEDERLEIGDYVSNQLEDLGFTVTRDYKTSAEASPCWLRGDPTEGCFNFYTGGWVSTAISRDEGSNFGYFYTNLGLPFPLWQAYTPTDEFYEVSEKLWNNEFATMEERTELMSTALDLALQDSARVWLFDAAGISPQVNGVEVAADLSGSVYGAQLWPWTLRRTGEVGGSMNVAMPSIMTEPWNPIAGTNWVYDMMPLEGLTTGATAYDPYTGLLLPNRLTNAEVQAVEGLPIGIQEDWLTLEFVPEIVVPDDAWADWDAVNQVWITAGERFTETATALVKVTAYYEEDLFDKMTWHDGSPLDLSDMVMMMIMQFDPSKPESPIYDEATVPAFESFMGSFKGWKIASEDPVVVEYYTDAYNLDAENNVTSARAGYPGYFNYVEAGWHNLVPGWMADANGQAAFSADKAEVNEVEWLSYIAGPSLDIMAGNLISATEENLIPYAPTLGNYITAEEAEQRYANIGEFYRRYGHFQIGTGPYYLQRAFPVEGMLILQRYDAYPDAADKWSQFAEAPIPEVMLDGSDRVNIGDEAVYDIYVDFEGEPYAADDIFMVKYLVFDAVGELVLSAEADLVEDGHYQATLGSDLTGTLEAGSNQFAVIVVSKRALVPVTETLQFVTQ